MEPLYLPNSLHPSREVAPEEVSSTEVTKESPVKKSPAKKVAEPAEVVESNGKEENGSEGAPEDSPTNGDADASNDAEESNDATENGEAKGEILFFSISVDIVKKQRSEGSSRFWCAILYSQLHI